MKEFGIEWHEVYTKSAILKTKNIRIVQKKQFLGLKQETTYKKSNFTD